MKKTILFSLAICFYCTISAQIPAGYYNSANGKSGKNLQQSLSEIINNHRTVSYSSLWQYFFQTDTKGDSIIWDIYSDNPSGVNSYDFVIYENQCVQVGSGEGHCYNREHTFCQSWFGGGTGAPYSDLFHIYPVDGYINSTRNNYPYGIVNSPTRTFSNGSKYGTNRAENAPASNAFEPIDDYKGDIARSFFYMATRYMFEDGNFTQTSPMTYKSQLQPWALAMLLDWHLLDPVSDKERNRNSAVYGIQQNRNPFIDYPELAGKIWGNDSIYPFIIDDTTLHLRPKIDYFEARSPQILLLHANMPLLTSSVINAANYTIQNGGKVEQVLFAQDTIYIYLETELQNGKNYHLIVRNLQAENHYFMTDTSIAFMTGVPQNKETLAFWTFDISEQKANIPSRINANTSPHHFATLYMDGSYGSSVLNLSGGQSQLDFFAGTLIGDPRGTAANASQSLAIIGNTTNQQAVVLAFEATGYQNYSLTFACRRTSSGFTEHQWEWSIDGVGYHTIDNSNTIPQTVAEFELCHLDLRNIDALNQADTVYLRLTVDGATSSTGNNRFDNIVIYAENDDVGIAEYPSSSLPFNAYPNPSRNRVIVVIDDDSFTEHLIHCHNANGKLVHSSRSASTSIEIDLSSFASGTYIITIYDEKSRKAGSKKIISQK